MWKTFCHFYRADSIKTNLLTCNLLTKWSVSYKSINLFWLNYFWHWMWKRICYSNRANSNLRIDIFDIGCEKHSRRNAFRTYLQLPLRQWGTGNFYLLVLSNWKVNITDNPNALKKLLIIGPFFLVQPWASHTGQKLLIHIRNWAEAPSVIFTLWQ